VALNPNHTMAHMWRGNAVLAQGRLREAFGHYEAAFALDPQHPAVTHNYLDTLIELGEHDRAWAVLSNRRADDTLAEMAAHLALVRADFTEVERLADGLTDDPVTAALLRWRLEVTRQNFVSAESHLAAAARSAPDDERVYLAALEHQTLVPGAMQFHGVLSHWQDGTRLSDKGRLMARAWQAIGQVKRGEMRAAAEALVDILSNLDEVYPPLRMKLVSHLLVALEHSGQQAAYEHWRRAALAEIPDYVSSGWASWEFQVERGYLLAAAGETDRAMESFRAAGRLGDVSTLRLSGDPRIHDDVGTDALADFI
ncbi:MAG: tetratricopeptide repeat protein, partial [Gammaproteobacteria bacterium]